MKREAEITLEAAIVVPLAILMVIGLIYFSFFVHDILVLKSYAYSVAVDNQGKEIEDFSTSVKKKIEKAPTLIIDAKVDCSTSYDKYIITIEGNVSQKTKLVEGLIEKIEVEVKLEDNMKMETIYFTKGAINLVEGKEQWK